MSYYLEDEFDDRYSRPATEAEAHVEWHINAGVPMGTPGCPQDACHGEPEYDFAPAMIFTGEDYAAMLTASEAIGRADEEASDDDDLPF